MRNRALDVESTPFGARERPGCGDVHECAEDADHDHQAALDLGRIEQAADRHDGQDAGQDKQGRAVGLRGQDLRAAEPNV